MEYGISPYGPGKHGYDKRQVYPCRDKHYKPKCNKKHIYPGAESCPSFQNKNINPNPYNDIVYAKALILTCIDYRFVDSTIFYLESNPKLSNSYDVTALAGGSLGYTQKKYEHWRKTFIDHVKLAIELHNIQKIIVFDHMDCGAYQLFYPEIETNSEEERELHIKNIKKFIHKLYKIFPQLEYRGYLIHDNNYVEKIV